jgi:hypothetical protein
VTRNPVPTNYLALVACTVAGLALGGAFALWITSAAGPALPIAVCLPIGVGALAGWRRAAAAGRWRAAVDLYADRQLIARYRKRVW